MESQAKKSKVMTRLSKNSDLALTFGFFGIIVLLVIPVATGILDVLLAASIGISLMILLLVMYVKEPSEFSVFPVILLAVTLLRLGLNVASTRLILLDGYAGEVIQSFGYFVVRGNYVVGAVVFLILVVINFVVITKGAGRIAEVAARFTLDSLPGKQMSIDAELNAGLIDEATAKSRRVKVQKEADFYGAMDGASKFVRGDAVAGILITLINIVGGIAIGVFQKGLPLAESLQKYTLLSIGDGLVSQIPALIVSVGAGILITRTSEDSDLGSHMGRQLKVYPRPVKIAAVMLLMFALLPGMPFFAFALLAALVGLLGYSMGDSEKKLSLSNEVDSGNLLPGPRLEDEGRSDAESKKIRDAGDVKRMIKLDVFGIELGYGLLSLADKKQSGDLLDRIGGVRKKFARDMGMILPSIALNDNLELDQNEYRFLLRGKEVSRGTLMPNRFLAVNVSGVSVKLDGVETVEPVFNLPAVWIAEDERQNAEIHGFTVVDGASVLITHLTEVLKDKAYLILEREDVQKLLDVVKEENPTLINELLPDLVTVGLIQRVLQNLLAEKVPINNLTLMLETIGDYASYTKNPDDLAEQVRKRLGVYFVEHYLGTDGYLDALTLDPRLEQHLLSRVKRTQFDVGLMMDPVLTQRILEDMKPGLEEMVSQGKEPVVITIQELRLAFKRFFCPSFPKMTVLSYQELPANVDVRNFGVISVSSEILEEQGAQQMTAQ